MNVAMRTIIWFCLWIASTSRHTANARCHTRCSTSRLPSRRKAGARCLAYWINRSRSADFERDSVCARLLAIFNIPVESSTGWDEIFDSLKGRDLDKVRLVVADGIKGLDTVVGEKFPSTPLQRCVTHLKRNMFAKVNHGAKCALAADLRDIFPHQTAGLHY